MSTDVGSASIDACEFGCTGAAACGGPECIRLPGDVVVAAEAGEEGVRRLLRRKAALRRTPMSESERRAREECIMHEQTDGWDGIDRMDTIPENASRSVSHPPTASNWAIAAALCFRRPESV